MYELQTPQNWLRRGEAYLPPMSSSSAETVKAIQERINALEASIGQDPSQIFLSKPYVTSQQLPAISTSISDSVEVERALSSLADLVPLTAVLVWMHSFAASLCLPFGHHDHLSSGLFYVVYLWANRLSPAVDGQAEAEALIPAAAVLLSLYYLDAGHLPEGKYHCAGATSLALTAGLHRIGSPVQISHPLFAFPNAALTVPTDTTRSKEMIDAFWSVVIRNNYWVAASGVTSSISSEVLISTPWPTDKPTLDLPSTMAVPESDPHRLSSLALLVQASIILDRIKRQPPEDAETQPRRVGWVRDPLFHFSEFVRTALKASAMLLL
ncbi:hypothetical protein B0H11DRAFT_2387175 [Mycena galericulata]|nr:hypothetical protein B0H11DRAFT_2387175 [Mycena galericulata]